MSENIKSTIYQTLFQPEQGRSNLTRIRIANAVIDCLNHEDLTRLNFLTISKKANVSRTILVRYFPTEEDLLMFTTRYIRAIYQEYVVSRLDVSKGSEKLLADYIRYAMLWVQEMNSHANAWVMVYYLSAVNKTFRRVHTELTTQGAQRVTAIVETGVREGVFRCEKPAETAREIHLLLSGSVLALMTENPSANPGLIDFTIRKSLARLRIKKTR
jgi:AcrR family transcriptional regulator